MIVTTPQCKHTLPHKYSEASVGDSSHRKSRLPPKFRSRGFLSEYFRLRGVLQLILASKRSCHKMPLLIGIYSSIVLSTVLRYLYIFFTTMQRGNIVLSLHYMYFTALDTGYFYRWRLKMKSTDKWWCIITNLPPVSTWSYFVSTYQTCEGKYNAHHSKLGNLDW